MRFPKKLIEKNLWDMVRNSKKIRSGGFVYWVNSTTLEVYAMSEDAWNSGRINGDLVAVVSDDLTSVTKI